MTVLLHMTPLEGAIILLTALVSVAGIFLFTCLSVLIVFIFKTLFGYIVYAIWLTTEILVALIAAITSGATVTLSILAAAGVATTTLPPSCIEARISLTIGVASAAIFAAAAALISLTSLQLNTEIAVSIIAAAAISVGCAAAWAVGVMSLIERETQHVGLKMTSLLDTVRHNNYRVLRILIKLHAGLKQQELDLALLHSVKAGYPECTDILLNNGADPNCRDYQENTALGLACESGNCKIARMLITKGAQVNNRNGSRGTALHYSAKWGYEDCVELLLSRGADPNVQDGQWQSPLMLASGHAHQAHRIMRMLITAGCSVNTVGTADKSALHYASQRGYVKDVTLLLEAKADIHMVDVDGNTCLHLAAREGCADVIEVLLCAGCDASAKNAQQRAPLHLAAMRGHMRTTKLLISAGADGTLTDANNNLPIWYAAYYGHSRTVQFFVTRNVPLKKYYKNGREIFVSNPLDIALEKRHLSVVKILVMAGCDVTSLSDWLNDIPIDFKHDYRSSLYLEWFRNFISIPLDLTHLCRLKVRHCIGPDFIDKAKCLPLPSALQQFLLMLDLEEELVSFRPASRALGKMLTEL